MSGLVSVKDKSDMIRLAAVGAQYENVMYALNKIGIETIPVESNPSFPQSTAFHADMALFSFGDQKILVDAQRKQLVQTLKSRGFHVTETSRPAAGEYPNDVMLNCFALGKYLVCNEKHADANLLQEAKQRSFKICHVNQGYAKCSSLVVNSNAIITDDITIKCACDRIGADSLLIEKGGIYLDDIHCGFIGGASCMLSPELAAFFGSLDSCRDSEKIKLFLSCHGVEYIELLAENLVDIGGIVALC